MLNKPDATKMQPLVKRLVRCDVDDTKQLVALQHASRKTLGLLEAGPASARRRTRSRK